jgi:trigger factor
MNVTTTPAPKSTVLVEVELPPERLSRAVDQSVRRLGRTNRVPGFRPGKAPRAVLERVLGPGTILDDAVEHLVEDAYREALVQEAILPLANADVEIVQAEEGKPLLFKATVPVRPDVKLGDYRGFPFAPEIEEVTDARVDEVIDELRDEYASLVAVEDRPARKGDWAVVSFVGTKDGEPFENGSAERVPLILGEERLIPGFEDHVIGLDVGASTEFDITFPEDYGEATLAGQPAHFAVTLRELRERVLPELDDEFARSLGDFSDLDEARADIRVRLGRNALDRARHAFADRIIEYAVANATLDLPDILVEQETEVMHDEFRASLARQGIGEEAYLKATEKTEADLHTDFRPRAEERVKTLLVLSRIAEAEGVQVPDADVDVEIARARERYGDDQRLVRYFESERGRDFIRSTLRRSRTVELLIDEWLAAHPDHPALPHLEDDASPVDAGSVASAASIGATDPGMVMAETGEERGSAPAEVVPAAAERAAVPADAGAAPTADRV